MSKRWNLHDLESRQGMSLLEVISYVAIFTVVTVLSSKLMMQSSALYQVQVEFTDQSRAITALDHSFRKTLRGLHSVVDSWGEFKTSPREVVMRGADSAGGTNYTIFRLTGTPARLTTVTMRSHGDSSRIQEQLASPLLLDQGEFVVETAASGRSLLRLRYRIHSDAPSSRERPIREIVAALQGVAPVTDQEDGAHE